MTIVGRESQGNADPLLPPPLGGGSIKSLDGESLEGVSGPRSDHAVTSLSGGGGTYTYDANGNMITRVEGGLTYTQTFDAENTLISVTVSGQTTQFIYGGDCNLVKKVYPDNSRQQW